jgi:hypothetical protein
MIVGEWTLRDVGAYTYKDLTAWSVDNCRFADNTPAGVTSTKRAPDQVARLRCNDGCERRYTFSV